MESVSGATEKLFTERQDTGVGKDIEMPKFKVPVQWSMTYSYIVQAKSKKEAVMKVNEMPLPKYPLPEYLDGSFTFFEDEVAKVPMDTELTPLECSHDRHQANEEFVRCQDLENRAFCSGELPQ